MIRMQSPAHTELSQLNDCNPAATVDTILRGSERITSTPTPTSREGVPPQHSLNIRRIEGLLAALVAVMNRV